MVFIPNESLMWTSRDPNGFSILRPVMFLHENDDGLTADVVFGEMDGRKNIHRVPLTELSIEAPAGIRPEYQIPPPPPPPARVPIEVRRDALRQCHKNAAASADALAAAGELLQRARAELHNAMAELAKLERIEAEHQAEATAAIRAGKPLADTADYDVAEKHKTATRIAAQAETAIATFHREFVEIETRHRSDKAAIATAASNVIAAVIETSADELKEMEAAAAKLRTSLRAAIELWVANNAPVAVHSEIVGFVVQQPQYALPEVASLNGRQAAVEVRQRPFRDLYERLLSDPEAEFD